IVNHYRDELAATARFHRPLTALYASLGVPLAPHWDLRAYEVRQLGASVEPASAGLITVRASVKNAAAQPQPLPVLRVTLQDRFGNRIAARDVAPPLYLPHATIRSEEHTSELQSLAYLVCRLLLEKKNERAGPRATAEAVGYVDSIRTYDLLIQLHELYQLVHSPAPDLSDHSSQQPLALLVLPLYP